jgi:hypothetical protein
MTDMIGHNPLDTTALHQILKVLPKDDITIKTIQERHHNCLQDSNSTPFDGSFHYQSVIGVIITRCADKILASYMTPDHVINLQVYQKSNMVQSYNG